jgi:hypothetical protein
MKMLNTVKHEKQNPFDMGKKPVVTETGNERAIAN